MRLWDILRTYTPVLIQDQDNHNNVNLNWLTRFGRLEVLAADYITSLFLIYVHAIIWQRRLKAMDGVPHMGKILQLI